MKYAQRDLDFAAAPRRVKPITLFRQPIEPYFVANGLPVAASRNAVKQQQS
ncbi:hypothetical protein VTH06DRAFT_5018 [Thermothelomyces fergusii]